jgi:ABC-type transport system substrate-binding protein
MSDRLAYHFLMRPGITFHDGSPLTAHDVAFSLQLLKEKGIRSFSNCFTILLAPRHPMTVPWW